MSGRLVKLKGYVVYSDGDDEAECEELPSLSSKLYIILPRPKLSYYVEKEDSVFPGYNATRYAKACCSAIFLDRVDLIPQIIYYLSICTLDDIDSYPNMAEQEYIESVTKSLPKKTWTKEELDLINYITEPDSKREKAIRLIVLCFEPFVMFWNSYCVQNPIGYYREEITDFISRQDHDECEKILSSMQYDDDYWYKRITAVSPKNVHLIRI